MNRQRDERWTLVHLEEDACIYRAYSVDTGAWLTPPLTRLEALQKCREWQWGAIRIQLELGNGILFSDRRIRFALSKQKRQAR